jgi:hypothetical protein
MAAMSTSFPEPPEARAKSKPIWQRWWFWALVLTAILIAASAGTSDDSQRNAETSAPSTASSTADVVGVEGQDVDTATSVLRAQGFEVRIKGKLTADAAADVVLHQSPAPGSTVRVGHTIVLTVAEPLPEVPNVLGDKVAKARSQIKDAGFGVTVKQRESSKPKGTVIEQSPKAGTSARPGRTIKVVVAKAPTIVTQPSSCDPNYSGCLNPNAIDYDCSGGSGDGPLYTGRVDVLGVDHYGLDADGDGVGCE